MLYLTFTVACFAHSPLPQTPDIGTTSPPKISDVYTASVTSRTSGNIPGLPQGESSFTEYYDFTNKRRRLDFTAGSLEGQTKVYRYDEKDVNHNPFPAPRGYIFRTENPKLDCCWLWLIDSSDPTNSTNEKMFEVEIPKNAKDEGVVTINGQQTEHWHSQGGIIIISNSDDFYVGNNSELVQHNSIVHVEGKKGISNSSYANFDVSPIDESVFAVPSANCQDSSCSVPEIGVCKQFGVDPMCDMNTYDSTGDFIFFRRHAHK